MRPTTRRTASGSLNPDSPSRVRAIRRRRLEPRSRAKIAAGSVAATIEPSSSPRRIERSRSQVAASPANSAVRIVPTTASDSAGPSTGRISPKPALRPPSNRTSPGTLSRPAASEATRPAAISAPATRMIRASLTRQPFQRLAEEAAAAARVKPALAVAGRRERLLVELVALGRLGAIAGLEILGGVRFARAHAPARRVGLLAERLAVGVGRVPWILAPLVGIGPFGRVRLPDRAGERVVRVGILCHLARGLPRRLGEAAGRLLAPGPPSPPPGDALLVRRFLGGHSSSNGGGRSPPTPGPHRETPGPQWRPAAGPGRLKERVKDSNPRPFAWPGGRGASSAFARVRESPMLALAEPLAGITISRGPAPLARLA